MLLPHIKPALKAAAEPVTGVRLRDLIIRAIPACCPASGFPELTERVRERLANEHISIHQVGAAVYEIRHSPERYGFTISFCQRAQPTAGNLRVVAIGDLVDQMTGCLDKARMLAEAARDLAADLEWLHAAHANMTHR